MMVQSLIKSLGDSDFSRSDRGVPSPLLLPVIPPPHHNHHDPHSKEVSMNAEASYGEASKTRKKNDGKRREMSNVEKGMIIAFVVIFGVIFVEFQGMRGEHCASRQLRMGGMARGT